MVVHKGFKRGAVGIIDLMNKGLRRVVCEGVSVKSVSYLITHGHK